MQSQIQAYLRKSASRGRAVERVGSFLATISPDIDSPYLNYAIPDDGAEPTPAEVEALIACYRRHKRTPRLEYMAENAPAVEAALTAQGFTREGRIPLMVYSAAAPFDMPTPEGIELIVPHTADDFYGMALAQSEAFGGDVPDRETVTPDFSFREAGGIQVYARAVATGEPVGGGVCDVPFDHTCELAGVGVRPAFRRQGVAAAITAWLVGQAFAAGTTTIFLMAADDIVARIYGRVGFVEIGEALHISLT